jgi:hypothetical protein
MPQSWRLPQRAMVRCQENRTETRAASVAVVVTSANLHHQGFHHPCLVRLHERLTGQVLFGGGMALVSLIAPVFPKADR